LRITFAPFAPFSGLRMTSTPPARLDLKDYVTEVEREVTDILGRQRAVLLRFLEAAKEQGVQIDHCGLMDCSPLRRYREAIQDAVRVLCESRRAFKSRQLELLRKRLEEVLDEEDRKV
jgi:hypothetical protein